jgi:hypothetical protein
MFHIPDHYHDLSLKLSEVLDDIGVNETMIMKWRKSLLLSETMETIAYNSVLRKSKYMLGSLSEGTTTVGIHSDSDSLCSDNDWNVIQDYTEWQPGLTNLLMIQNENTSPGYCFLQVLRNDVPVPYTRVENEHCVKVSSDTVLVKNTVIHVSNSFKHGPAWVKQGAGCFRDSDLVLAYHCKSWPKEARQWLHRGDSNVWPTSEIKRFAEKNGCFVVPVASKLGHSETLEWRISTSLAERSLMYSLNITQIRCYILMKMILKTYLNFQDESHLSSFMCKTVLLYCIENTEHNLWKNFNLLKCLSYCLHRLYTSLIDSNCPHFIIPGNNLMAGKLSIGVKRKLLDKLSDILQSNGHALFGIQLDDLGTRLQTKLNMLRHLAQPSYATHYEILLQNVCSQILLISQRINLMHNVVLMKSSNDSPATIRQILLRYLQNYTAVYREGNTLEQLAVSLLVPSLCSTLGTIIASLDIQSNNGVSSEAFDWLHYGVNSDVSAGRLKLASVFIVWEIW